MKTWLKALVIILGVLLLCLSVVVTMISASRVSIIGGAGWVTFRFFFQKNAWMAISGALLILFGILFKKK